MSSCILATPNASNFCTCRTVRRASKCHGNPLPCLGSQSSSDSTHPAMTTRRFVLSGLVISLPGRAAAVESVLDISTCSDFRKAGDLEFCDLSIGDGDPAAAGDLVEVDYTARSLSTGKVYDGSKGFQFYVGQGEIIAGWDEALLGNSQMKPMKEGGQRTVRLPPSLAYGQSGSGCVFGLDDNCRVPPNSSVEITFKYKGLRG